MKIEFIKEERFMPRKKHEWYIGDKLHVIARGNHRNDIFRDETDYELYLSYLNEAMEYYQVKFDTRWGLIPSGF